MSAPSPSSLKTRKHDEETSEEEQDFEMLEQVPLGPMPLNGSKGNLWAKIDGVHYLLALSGSNTAIVQS